MNRRHAMATVSALCLAAFGSDAQSEEAAGTARRLLEAVSPLGDRTLGSADAPVVLIEYASATCPHCAEFHEKVLPQIKSDYIDTGKVRFIFREFPLDKLALGAFMLARCVPEDKYFATLDLMFRRQRTWATAKNPADELFRITQMAGMDRAGFEACIKRDDMAMAMVSFSKASRDQFGIKGTPAIFVNGLFVDAHDDMPAVKAALDRAINR